MRSDLPCHLFHIQAWCNQGILGFRQLHHGYQGHLTVTVKIAEMRLEETRYFLRQKNVQEGNPDTDYQICA